MSKLTFAYENHLGGCVLPSNNAPNGDPLTYCPKMWDWLIETNNVKSVLDVGCGAGFSTKYFQEKKLKTKGIEACQEAIDKAVATNIIKHDFRDGINTPKEKYDLAWCSEVLEHIDPIYERNVLETLSDCDIIAITHAFPGQGGYHHVNLQRPSYWIKRFQDLGYQLDVKLTQSCRMITRFETNENHHFNRSGLIFRKIERTKHKNALLTWASGPACHTQEMNVFLKSLVYQGDKIVFTHDMDLEAREKFQNANFHIIDVNPNDVTWIVRDRFYYYAEFLKKYKYKKVVLVDSRDILFQKDISCLNEYTSELVVVSEGHLHKESPWNIEDQKRLQSRVPKKDFQDWEVINGGFQFGNSKNILKLCEKVYEYSNYGATDQAALNYLVRLWKDVTIINPHDNDLVLHGEPIHTGVFIPQDYKKYTVFHQWDRTNFKIEILEQYED